MIERENIRAPAGWWLTSPIPSILMGDLYSNGRPRLNGRLSRAWRDYGRFEVAVSLWPQEHYVECSCYLTVQFRVPVQKDYRVGVTWTTLKRGRRAALRCLVCDRSTKRLFLDAQLRFVCRDCAGMKYVSQSMPRYIRKLERAKAIRVSMGGAPTLGAPIPEKPKNMQWKRYEQERATLLECEAEYWDGVFERRVAGLKRLSLSDERDHGLRDGATAEPSAVEMMRDALIQELSEKG